MALIINTWLECYNVTYASKIPEESYEAYQSIYRIHVQVWYLFIFYPKCLRLVVCWVWSSSAIQSTMHKIYQNRFKNYPRNVMPSKLKYVRVVHQLQAITWGGIITNPRWKWDGCRNKYQNLKVEAQVFRLAYKHSETFLAT